jgi:hypothetical protein
MTMDKDDIFIVMRDILENAVNLENALERAKQIFQHDDCPEPHDQWDDMAELAGFAAADVICGDIGQNISKIIKQLDVLVAGVSE